MYPFCVKLEVMWREFVTNSHLSETQEFQTCRESSFVYMSVRKRKLPIEVYFKLSRTSYLSPSNLKQYILPPTKYVFCFVLFCFITKNQFYQTFQCNCVPLFILS